ncbi:MAG: hypothetical protein NTZ12_06695 [Candidatus Aminicenantes bacterium]|nr:hypothetical protein [Candidatus Aminicenantes bacterium]
MVKRYLLSEGKIIASENETSPILVYINPSDAEKRYLTEELKLDEHTLNSSLDPDELSRLEFEPEHVAVIFKRPKSYAACDNFLFRVSSLGLFLFKDRLVILLTEDNPLFEGKPYVRGLSLPKVMLSLLYRSIFHFIEHLKIINMLSDSLEQKINASMENKYLLNLFILEKSLVYSSTPSTPTPWSSRRSRTIPSRSASTATPRSSSTTFSSRTTNATSRRKSIPTSFPA